MNLDDEIIREVRRIRAEHARSLGHDLRRIFDDLKAEEQRSSRKLVEFPPRRPRPNHEAAVGS